MHYQNNLKFESDIKIIVFYRKLQINKIKKKLHFFPAGVYNRVYSDDGSVRIIMTSLFNEEWH